MLHLHQVTHFLYLVGGDTPATVPPGNHFGIEVYEHESLSAIVARAKAFEAERDPAVEVIDAATEDYGPIRIHNAYPLPAAADGGGQYYERLPIPHDPSGRCLDQDGHSAYIVHNDHRGLRAMAEAVRASATEFKQHVGKYLDVARTGRVVIERQGRPTAVLISVEEYEALNPSASRVLDTLTEEFDALVSRMQRPGFGKAMEKAFDASPRDLGRAHQRGVKRRGR